MEKPNAYVSQIIKTVFIETGYAIVIAFISFCKGMLNTLVTQAASESEISRLNGQTPLALSESLIHYNNTLHFFANALIIVFIVLGVYTLYKSAITIMKITKKTEESDSSENK